MSVQTDRRANNVPHMVDVSPNVDPSMRGGRRNPTAAQLLREMGHDTDDDLRERMFANTALRTKEEQLAQQASDDSNTNTLLIVVFALVVIALVAIIVWMALGKDEGKKRDEQEIKRQINPYNHMGMPPLNYQMRNAHHVASPYLDQYAQNMQAPRAPYNHTTQQMKVKPPVPQQHPVETDDTKEIDEILAEIEESAKPGEHEEQNDQEQNAAVSAVAGGEELTENDTQMIQKMQENTFDEQEEDDVM